MIICLILFLLSFSMGYATQPIIESDDCIVCFHAEGFLVKQVKDPSPYEQFLLVLDAAACQIAASVDLPINRVHILPAYVPFPGKTYLERPATLHTRVPGRSIPESDMEVRIHQRVKKENAQWPLPPEREGLNVSIIECMGTHPDLPGIVALDTFVGNGDRSQPNLFYDSETDHYYGIDLAASFCSELGKAACVQIARFQENEAEFSLEAIAGLKKYAEVLEQLMFQWSAEAIEALLLDCAHQAGFKKGELLWCPEVEARIAFHCKLIRSNHDAIRELFQQLKAFLNV